MAIDGGANQERKRLATKAGVTAAQSIAMSGADLHQKALSNATGQAVGAGIDGARLMQLEGGAGV